MKKQIEITSLEQRQKIKQLEITFCDRIKNFDFQNDKELLIAEIPLKGITRINSAL
jgi:hypothetical protein